MAACPSPSARVANTPRMCSPGRSSQPSRSTPAFCARSSNASALRSNACCGAAEHATRARLAKDRPRWVLSGRAPHCGAMKCVWAPGMVEQHVSPKWQRHLQLAEAAS